MVVQVEFNVRLKNVRQELKKKQLIFYITKRYSERRLAIFSCTSNAAIRLKNYELAH